MKKKVFNICIFAFLMLGILATALFFLLQDKSTYTIDTSLINATIAHNSDLSLDEISIIKQNGKSNEVIKITPDMIVSGDETDTVGQKQLVIKYKNETFVVNYTVKYKVEFVVNNEVVSTQYVLDKEDIDYPATPEMVGCDFIGWGSISNELETNMTFNAQFTVSNNVIPMLLTCNATYGDTLNDVNLPSNTAGSWRFVKDLSTPVGNAGTNEFDVKFVPSNPYLITTKVSKVKVKVAKKNIKFTDITNEFYYDGTEKQPIFDLGIEGINVDYSPYYSGKAINVGVYNYELNILDANYTGSYYGKFEIKSVYADVIIDDINIKITDAYPQNFTYCVKDANGEPLNQDLIDLMGLAIIKPSYQHAGQYAISAKVNNDNFTTFIHYGYLNVDKVELNLDQTPPVFVNGPKVTYGSILSSVKFFNMDVRGDWKWETPEIKVLTDTTFVAVAIFVPKEDRDYLTSRKEVQLNVEKKKITINVTKQEYTYDASNHTIEYTVSGLEGEDSVNIIGNKIETTAGEYEVLLSVDLDDKRYIGTTDTKLIINKASISDFSTIYNIEWNTSLILKDIKLQQRYEWIAPSTLITEVGQQSFLARFTPEDTTNYKTEQEFIVVNVSKANVNITAPDTYVFSYNPNGYLLNGIVAPHNEQDLQYSYTKDGKVVNNIDTVGSYKVEVSLPETDHYNATRKAIDVTVIKRENTDQVIKSCDAVYGDTLNKFTLPDNETGVWSWEIGEDSKVGNAGVQKHTAIFTPIDTENYESRTVEVVFSVSKKVVQRPIIQSKTYNDSMQVADISNTFEYTVVTNNGGEEKGEYDVILELNDSDNYTWGNTEETKQLTLEFKILKNTNNIWQNTPTITGWTYGNTANNPVSSSLYGDVIVEYKLKSADDSTYTATKPSKAGTYLARFSVADNNSYNGLDNVIVEFDIAYIVVSVPTILAKIYNGSAQVADIPSSKYFSVVKNEENTDAGNYDVVIELNNDSYKWSDSYELERTLTFTINKVTNTDTVNVTRTAIYKELLGKFSLPESETGVWSWKIGATSEVGTAGTQVHIAVFTPTDAVNYESREVEITFNVAKKVVQLPIIASVIYNGENQVANISNTLDYKVVTNNGGIKTGDYQVVLELNDSANYRWAVKENENQVELTFKILKNVANNWTTIPTISSWTYGEDACEPESEATFGELVIEYKLKSADDSTYTTTKPSKAGTYIARFTVAESESYNGLNQKVEFDINYIVVDVPTIASTTYNTEEQTANLATSDKYTIVTENLTYTDAGSYDIVLKLNNDSYKWTDSYELTRTLKYVINKVTNKDSVTTEVDATYKDLLGQYSLPTNATGVWTWKAGETSEVGNAGEQAHIAVFTPNNAKNYEGREVEVKFTVAKKVVQLPIIASATYNGENQIADISTTTEYKVVANNGGITKGEYDVVLELIDSANYYWAGKEEENQITVLFKIAQNANNKWETIPNITGWTFDNNANEPVSDAKYGSVVVEYKLKTDDDSKYTTTVPSNPGTYIARFSVIETDSYNGLDQIVEFNIAYLVVTVPTIASTTYNKEEQTALLATSDKYTIVTENLTYTNAGTYDIVIKLNKSGYKWTDSYDLERIVTFTINKAKNTDTVTTERNATYKDLLGQYLLPTSATGVWTWKAGETSEVGNAGEQTHTAVFTPSNENYEEREVQVKFTVAKKVAGLPNIKSEIFNNTLQKPEVLDTDIYTVETNNGGITKGEYDVVLKLKDSANYCWKKDDTSVTTILKFNILKNNENNWKETPTLEGWTFEDDSSKSTGEALYGDYTVKYKLKTEADTAYTLTVPTMPGIYTALFTVADNISYNGIDYTVEFNIAYLEVAVPTIASTTYNKEEQTAPLATSDKYTIVTENLTYTNAGTYNISIKLNKSGYKWTDSYNLERIVTFTINKAKNTDVVATERDATYKDLLGQYSLPTNEAGVWAWKAGETSEVGNAGEQTHTAVFTPSNENYEGREVEVTFTIAKKVVESLPQIQSVVFNNNPQKPEVLDTDIYTVETNNGGITKGEYDVVLKLKDSANYCWKKDDASLTTTLKFNILKNNENKWKELPALEGWTFEDDPRKSTGEALYGDYTVKYKLKTDADTSYTSTVPTMPGTYTALFTVADDISYNSIMYTVEFNIAYLEVTVPTIASTTYNKEEQTAPLATSDKYTILTQNLTYTNAGTYNISIKLNKSGYKWTDSYNLERIVTFTINKATDNKWVNGPIMNDFDYTPDPEVLKTKLGSASSKYGDVIITYSIDGVNYKSELEKTTVGTYYAKFEVKETTNYNGLTGAVMEFDINKATPVLPSVLSTIVYENSALEYIEKEFVEYVNGNKSGVKGTVSYNTLPTLVTDTLIDGGTDYDYAQTSFNVTFNPEDTNNYLTVTYDAKINVYAVCSIGSTYYGSIDNALDKAVNGNTVTVIPNTTGNVTIATDVTIKGGVTLLLPYGSGSSDYNSSTVATLIASDGKNFVNMSLQNQIVILDNVTVVNNGTLSIAGQLSGGNGGNGAAGHTAGKYAEIVLKENAKIVSTGTINCYGIIDESSDSNSYSQVIINSGTLLMPFVVNDFQGGTYMQGVYNKNVTPFNQFELRNIVPKLTVYSSASLIGNANLYTATFKQHNNAQGKLVGSSSDYLIELKDGGYIQAKYNPTRSNVDNNQWEEGVCDLHIYGGATANSLSLKVSGVTLSTSTVYFPLSWRFKITLHSGDYTMTTNFKMLPGNEFIVESDANLSATNINIYTTFPNQSGTPTPYLTNINTSTNATSRTLSPAKFILRGDLTATSIGGIVYADTDGATITTTNTSVTTLEFDKKTKGGFLNLVTYYNTKNITNDLVIKSATDINTAISSNTFVSEVVPTASTKYKLVNGVWTKQ